MARCDGEAHAAYLIERQTFEHTAQRFRRAANDILATHRPLESRLMMLAPIFALVLAASDHEMLAFNEDCRIFRGDHILFDGSHVDHGCIALVRRETVLKMVGQCSVAEPKEGCEFSFEDDDVKFSQAPNAICAFACSGAHATSPPTPKVKK